MAELVNTEDVADRAGRLMEVADTLLDKVDEILHEDEILSPASAKHLADVLKILKDIGTAKPREEEVPSVTVTLEGGLKVYAG
jgi:hypothetical protein